MYRLGLVAILTLSLTGCEDPKAPGSTTDKLFEKCVEILKNGELFPYSDPSRINAVTTLGLLGEERAVPVLLEHLSKEKSDQLRKEIIKSLGWIGSKKAIPQLEKALKDDPYEHCRNQAAIALKKITGKDYGPIK
jgi:HEAT repeat protein